ncbi:MAG: Crp/Fnr family transcriptional regulator [Saprospiraceae bacterium]
MKEQLEYFIRSRLKNPNNHEIKSILEIFHLKHFQKGEYFKRHENICKHLGFVLEGSVRHYAIKNNGSEMTGRISKKNDFVTDIISVRTKGETPISIKAIESSSILIATTNDVDHLLETNLTFNRLLREYMADNVVEMGKMRLLFLMGTAKERYKLILENNPNLLKSVPLRFIASMIGITPTQLSRIRNKNKNQLK